MTIPGPWSEARARCDAAIESKDRVELCGLAAVALRAALDAIDALEAERDEWRRRAEVAQWRSALGRTFHPDHDYKETT